jgi:exosortase/archaeosortase family protein
MIASLRRTVFGRTSLSFVLRACILLAVLSVAQLAPRFEDWVSVPLRRLDARVTHLVLRLVGVDTALRDTYVLGSEFSIDVIEQCTGIAMVTILVSLTCAFPAPWRARLWGIGLGLLVVYSANILRLTTLFIVGMKWPQLFEDTHKLVWQGALIFLVFIYWCAWARWAMGKPEEV